jgi:hypothetical protein
MNNIVNLYGLNIWQIIKYYKKLLTYIVPVPFPSSLIEAVGSISTLKGPTLIEKGLLNTKMTDKITKKTFDSTDSIIYLSL